MTGALQIINELPALPSRPVTMHKGQAGRVSIVAGSHGMSGAAVLAGWGALRGGAGLVRVYCPDDVQPVVAAAEPCLMTVTLPGKNAGTHIAMTAPITADEWADVFAVGPGLGDSASATAAVDAVVRTAGARPVVVDADGLSPLALRGPSVWRGAPRTDDGPSPALILTPHPGEMAALRAGAGLPKRHSDADDERVQIAREYAVLGPWVVVLKGHRTVVCDGLRAYINTSGNAGMATGGMGDVLTGLIAALLAQGLAPFEAACLGVHIHGLAGDLCAERIGQVGFLAREVADAIPAARSQATRVRVGFR